MPAKIRERDGERNRERDRARDNDAIRPKDRTRHKSTRSVRKSSFKDTEQSPTRPERSATITTPPNTRKGSLPKPELERRSSSNPATPSASKTSLPYPSFSKAHSKEAVGSREDIINKRQSYYTPDPTDLTKGNDEPVEKEAPINPGAAPPSPPLTTDPVPPVRVERDPSPHQVRTPTRKAERKKSDLQKAADELKRRLGRGGSITSKGGSKDRSPSSGSRRVHRVSGKDEDPDTQSPRRSKPSTPSRSRPKAATVEEDTTSTSSLRKSTSPRQSTLNVAQSQTESTTDSDATSIAPNQPSVQQPTTQVDKVSTISSVSTEEPIVADTPYTPSQIVNANQKPRTSVEESPMPPPPPPPPDVPFQMPKVDYLLHNGGLTQAVSKSLLNAGQPLPVAGQQFPPASMQVERFFSPFNNLLDDYVKVMGKSGSLAVATGYRSIARRLLDRLEAVFARDISSETCNCVMCQDSPAPTLQDQRGVSWGEILEYVCGRQELPQWPPFVLDPCQAGLGISAAFTQTPMQSLDVDVPDEYRDHYVRQSKKTKQAVDRWLQSQPSNPTSPPQDIDDETLTFAMLTRLDVEQRPIFSSLIGVASSRPPSRAGTPFAAPRSEFLTNTGHAIQRLYRLSSPPRDPESAIYLLSNPALHNVLATLAAISDAEWEILISGRFDGFLRSGAEDMAPNNMSNTTFSPMSNGNTISRGPTPIRMATPSMSRAPTPATLGAPVALDEETEIATLAEIEREIYLGMEALEDAFEALHGKAETVRNVLRQRGAGLAMANQMRRGNMNGANSLDARLGTPAGVGWESETDDGLGDEGNELAPDDSASNVSRSRRRRPGRRHERRTPAMVEEEDEDGE
ncbi:MAG: hypothetical protein L6R41_005977 [Letrouitia leprolyta]|nr:MAG: hypothetical protein L6R41_005977 [Letrouitia leprolyta]